MDLEAQIETLAKFIIAEIPGEPSQSEGAVDTAMRIIRDLKSRLAESEERVCGLREALYREQTGLLKALNDVRKEIVSRSWLLDGRGPYEWDDNRYKDEAGLAFKISKEIIDRAVVAYRKMPEC